MFCAHSREYWLEAELQGGWMGKRKRKERKNKRIIFCPQDFCAYLSRKNHTNKCTLDLLSNKTERSEVSGPLNKQHSLPGEGGPLIIQACIFPTCGWRLRSCFEGVRENAKRSQASLIFLPGTENALLECFPFPSKLYLLLNEHYNCFKRNDYRDESSTIQSLWDTSCFHPMSLSIPYLRCALIWYSWNHSVDDIFKIILKTICYISTLCIISISFSWLHYIPCHPHSSPGYAQYSTLNDFTTVRYYRYVSVSFVADRNEYFCIWNLTCSFKFFSLGQNAQGKAAFPFLQHIRDCAWLTEITGGVIYPSSG